MRNETRKRKLLRKSAYYSMFVNTSYDVLSSVRLSTSSNKSSLCTCTLTAKHILGTKMLADFRKCFP
jgi:hypothetical protein